MTKIPLKSAKNKPKSSFLWGLIQFAPNSNIKHLVYSNKNVPTELPRSGSSMDTLQKFHTWQFCPNDIGLTKKIGQKFVDQKFCQKSDFSKYSYFLEKNQNLDKSRFFIFKEKIKIRTRPDFYFSMQNSRSGLGDM